MSQAGDPLGAEAPYGLQRLVGYALTAWSEGHARVELTLSEDHMNRHGIPHGGVHAMLLDTAMGFAGSWTGDPARRRHAMTLSMTTNFIGRPVAPRLIAEARVTGGGARTFFAEGRLRDAEGTPVATATGVFRHRSEG
jgi:uncharacterized protein (TIGR00369 family)